MRARKKGARTRFGTLDPLEPASAELPEMPQRAILRAAGIGVVFEQAGDIGGIDRCQRQRTDFTIHVDAGFLPPDRLLKKARRTRQAMIDCGIEMHEANCGWHRCRLRRHPVPRAINLFDEIIRNGAKFCNALSARERVQRPAGVPAEHLEDHALIGWSTWVIGVIGVTALHFEDVRKLLEVLHRLVDQGNSVVVIEHNLDVIKTADWIVDLGPEGGVRGGEIVAEGTPEDVVKEGRSFTGQYLAALLERGREVAE